MAKQIDFARYQEEHSLKVSLEDRIATVAIDRPKSKNAVDYRVHQGLEHAFKELGEHPDVGCILLTGTGDSFCAGGDLKNFAPPDASVMTTLRNGNLNWAIAMCDAPTVAAVNGHALGLGATLALACDVIYMADTARIGDTHVKVGLSAGDGGQVVWPLLVGLHRAKEYLMTGKLLTGVDAERIGLVNYSVPADQLQEKAREWAREVADGAQVAIRFTKKMLNKLAYQNLNMMLDFGLASEMVCSNTEDTKEAMAAFREKRKPNYQGR